VRAAQRGARVTVVEEEALGGTCLNWGCIPTKTLLTGVKLLHAVERGAEFGVNGQATLDWQGLLARKGQVVARLGRGIEALFRKHSIALVPGRARLCGGGRVEVAKAGGSAETLSAGHVLVATGSVPCGLPGLTPDGRRVLDSRDALSLESPPRSMLIVGAGAIGCEFAHLLSAAGTRVVLVEALDGLLPLLGDSEVSTTLRQVFRKRGIEMHLGARVGSVEPGPDGLSVSLDTGANLSVETVLVSVGRRPRVEALGLEEAGVEFSRGGVKVDDRLRTTAPGISAVGDVTGLYALAHVASAQGIVAAENATGGDRTMDYGVIPSCVFTEPEVAVVGLTQAGAEDRGMDVAVGRFPWIASGRALAAGETAGWVKVVTDRKTGRIAGAQIVGPEATSLIAELALAIRAGVPAGTVVDTIHAHPTYAEAVAEAVGASLGRATHA
jgi:dihydrolipoamide dehydrogenase